jgi:hypothetical protein
MRWRLVTCLCGLLAVALVPAGAEDKSSLETNPKGWEDLLPGKDLKGWKRVPIPPDEKLNPKNPWSVDAEAKILHCDGVGIKEMLLQDTERGDGIFHVEWRFRKVEGKPEYNSGVYVRTAADGKLWHQAQVAFLEKPPLVADLFGITLMDGKPQKFQQLGQGFKHARGAGEWNTYEINCKGKTISVWLNGTVVTTWNECAVPKGLVGLQAEFYYIEFRNLKFQTANRGR